MSPLEGEDLYDDYLGLQCGDTSCISSWAYGPLCLNDKVKLHVSYQMATASNFMSLANSRWNVIPNTFTIDSLCRMLFFRAFWMCSYTWGLNSMTTCFKNALCKPGKLRDCQHWSLCGILQKLSKFTSEQSMSHALKIFWLFKKTRLFESIWCH